MVILAERQSGLRRLSPAVAAAFQQPVLKAFSAAIGQKDPYTRSHGMRVAAYAARLATRVGLAPKAIFWVALGGFLHDIGKLGFSDDIFSSADCDLSDRMRAEVRCHPLTGAMLLHGFPSLRPAVSLVLYHHERIDGKGYPFGLPERRIPLGARVVSIADCFDAMTTDRPYQKRKSVDLALAMLQDMAGRSLSADLVAAFIDDIKSAGLLPPMIP